MHMELCKVSHEIGGRLARLVEFWKVPASVLYPTCINSSQYEGPTFQYPAVHYPAASDFGKSARRAKIL